MISVNESKINQWLPALVIIFAILLVVRLSCSPDETIQVAGLHVAKRGTITKEQLIEETMAYDGSSRESEDVAVELPLQNTAKNDHREKVLQPTAQREKVLLRSSSTQQSEEGLPSASAQSSKTLIETIEINPQEVAKSVHGDELINLKEPSHKILAASADPGGEDNATERLSNSHDKRDTVSKVKRAPQSHKRALKPRWIYHQLVYISLGGESLKALIMKHYLGDANSIWPKVWFFNQHIENPHLLARGEKVVLPNLVKGSVLRLKKLDSVSASDSYTVLPYDDLSRISLKLFGSVQYWPKLWACNPDIENPYLLKTGSKINFLRCKLNALKNNLSKV
jgi:hypothetical protein